MKKCFQSPGTLLASALLAVLASAGLAQAASKDTAGKSAGRTQLVIHTVPEVAIPQSVFNIPSQPSEGRNPFFPQSMSRPVAAPSARPTPVEPTVLVLNGITSPPKRTVMINGRTFETGEEGEVRLPSGAKVLLKVEEIRADSAIVDVNGARREIRMRSGL